MRPMLIERPIKINGYDIDVMGIVSNIVYVRWFEDLRMAFLDTYWPYARMVAENQSPVLAHTEVDYKSPLVITDEPIGRLWVAEFSRARWRMEFEIATDKRIHCMGLQHGYVVDLTRKRPIPMPSELVKAFEADKLRLEAAVSPSE